MLKFLQLIFIFSITICQVTANNDSLIIELNKKSEDIRKNETQKAISYAMNAIDLIVETTPINLKALSYKNLGIALYYNYEYEEALINYKKSFSYYSLINDSLGISACYNNMAILYKDLSELDTALFYFQQALIIDKKMKNKKNMAIAFNNIGEVYHLMHKYIPALYYYNLSLKIEKKMNNKNGMADTYLNIGAVLELNGFFKEAISYYNVALSYYTECSDYRGLGLCYNNMGLSFTRLNEFNKAKDAFHKAIDYESKTNDIQGKITSLLNLGNLYILMGDTLKAKDSFKEAIHIYDNNAFTHLQKLEKTNTDGFSADDYFFYWVSSNIENGYIFEIPQSIFYKGYMHYNLGAYDKSILHFLNSLEIAENFNLTSVKKDNFLLLSKAYLKENDFEKAYYYAQQYITISDSLNASTLMDFMQIIEADTIFNENNNNIKEEKIDGRTKVNFWMLSTIVLLISSITIIILMIKKN